MGMALIVGPQDHRVIAWRRPGMAAVGPVAHDPAVVGMHPRSIGIEDSNDTDLHAIHSVIVEEERLGTTFPLVVAGSQANRIYITPIALGLWVHIRVSIDLTGRGL